MKKIILIITSLLLVTFIMAENRENIAPIKSINLKNASFEDAATPKEWTVQPDLKVEKNRGMENGTCLLMPESNTGRYYAFQQVKLEDKGFYVLSVFAKTDKKALAQIGIFKTKSLSDVSDFKTLSGNWEKISLRFYKNDDKPVYYNFFLSGYIPLGNVSWDNVRLDFYGENLKPDEESYRIEKLWSVFKSMAPLEKLPESFCRKQVTYKQFCSGPSPTVPGKFYIERPTHNCIGFEWYISGDYNRNGKVKVEYRKSGDERWFEAMPMHRNMFEVSGKAALSWYWVSPNMYAGSIFHLNPGTEYEIKLKLSDPDGGNTEKIFKTSTKICPEKIANSKELHVYPPDYKGEKTEPSFVSISAAYKAAVPGNTILIHPGVYKADNTFSLQKRYSDPSERYYLPPLKSEGDEKFIGKSVFRFDKKATLEQPIIIKGTDNEKVIIDGNGAGIIFDVSDSEYNYFRNLSIRNAERIFYCNNGKGLTIQDCILTDCRYGIDGGPAKLGDYYQSANSPLRCYDFTISDNIITGNWPEGKWRQGWASFTAKYGYGNLRKCIGIMIGGQGHDVCRNTVKRFWDGINTYWIVRPQGVPEMHSSSIDIYNNLISECPDDCIEMDFSVCNIRVYNNFVANSHMGISLQPLQGGPGYVFRNVIFNTVMFPLKIAQWPSGAHVYNNTFVTARGMRFVPQWQNTVMMNNLVLGSDTVETGPLWTGSPTPLTSFLDYNAYRNNGCKKIFWVFPKPDNEMMGEAYFFYDSLSEFSENTGLEKHGICGIDFKDLVNVIPGTSEHQDFENLDFRLSAGSKAIDKGICIPNLSGNFSGKAPDIGAYEYGSEKIKYGASK
ncbi:MAG: hypothetical protein A2017_19905 [Lentisphaerae bacterium GWF2_44_16]|nr:MAG: hypothetical protein A2017_19905 [Lentisphaerae bacterium GWF2_44_16]